MIGPLGMLGDWYVDTEKGFNSLGLIKWVLILVLLITINMAQPHYCKGILLNGNELNCWYVLVKL